MARKIVQLLTAGICFCLLLPSTHTQFVPSFSFVKSSQFSAPLSRQIGDPAKEEMDGLLKPLDALQIQATEQASKMELELSEMKGGLQNVTLPVELGKPKVSRALLDRLEKLEMKNGIKVGKMFDPKVLKEKCKTNPSYTWMETGSFCIRVVSDAKTWKDAQAFCSAEKSRLVKLDALTKIHTIRNSLPAQKGVGYFIGANNLKQNGIIWSDGNDLDPEINMWFFNQPSYYVEGQQTREDCVAVLYSEFYKLHYWDDVVCSQLKYFICELI